MNKGAMLYADKGIEIFNEKLYTDERILLNYSGILATSGADRIFAHYGYGDSWEEKEYIEMECHNGVFTAEIGLKMPGSMNICFKDSADNWDNNSNINYSFNVLAKKTARKSKKVILAE